MTRVYQWKHGWIPLTHTAAMSKAKGSERRAKQYLARAKESGGSSPRHLERWLDGSQRDYGVDVRREGGRTSVRTPYDEDFVSGVKGMGGQWDRTRQEWSVPSSSDADLDDLLGRIYSGDPRKVIDEDDLPASVTFVERDRTVNVSTPYDDEWRQAAKGLGGRWTGESWEFPRHRQDAVAAAAERIFGERDRGKARTETRTAWDRKWEAELTRPKRVEGMKRRIEESVERNGRNGFPGVGRFLRPDGSVDTDALAKLTNAQANRLRAAIERL